MTHLSEVQQRFRDAYKGHGRAVRLRHEPPMPGEPYMSMDDAALISARVYEEMLTRPPSSAALETLRNYRDQLRYVDFFLPRVIPDFYQYRGIWPFRRRVKVSPTQDQLDWAGHLARGVVLQNLADLIEWIEAVEARRAAAEETA